VVVVVVLELDGDELELDDRVVVSVELWLVEEVVEAGPCERK
jgi:hypothetical protein